MIDLPDDITTYDEAKLTELIQEIRKRRDRPVAAFKAAQALVLSKIEDKLRVKIEKELRMFAKTLAAIDKRIEELENRAVRITAMRLEAGDIHDGRELVHWQGSPESERHTPDA